MKRYDKASLSAGARTRIDSPVIVIQFKDPESYAQGVAKYYRAGFDNAMEYPNAMFMQTKSLSVNDANRLFREFNTEIYEHNLGLYVDSARKDGLSASSRTIGRRFDATKTANAKKVLRLMDEDYSYSDALAKVIADTGADKAQLEKELDPFI